MTTISGTSVIGDDRNTPHITDDQWESLLDVAQLEINKKKADETQARFTKERWRELRRLAKTNLFFLSTGVLDYDRLSVDLHGHMCEWEAATATQFRFREWLLPRGHFKSTIITIAHSIQLALPDDVGDQPWPGNLGPKIRILIAHEVGEKASDYLFEITSHFMSNPTLMALFPECVPVPKKQRINKTELSLPYEGKQWKEATFDTMGVGGKTQGAHYNFLKLDDLIGDKARDSESEMMKAKNWLDNIQSFFSLFKADKFDLVGTRWANDDIYDHMEERYGKLMRVYRRKVEEKDPKTGELKPIFPEEFDATSLAVLKKNRKVFSAQYENDPDSGNRKFHEEWLRYYTWVDPKRISITHKVPNEHSKLVGTMRTRVIHLDDCNISFLYDPAVSGTSGFNVIATDEYSNNFVLEAIQQEWEPPDFVSFLFNKVLQYRPRVVGIEEVLFSSLYKHWIESEMRLRGIRFTIQELDAKQKEKPIRVLGLSPYFEASKIWYNETRYSKMEEHPDQMSHLVYQTIKFGSIKRYDVLDSLGYLPAVSIPAVPKRTQINRRESENRRLIGRNNITGYSK